MSGVPPPPPGFTLDAAPPRPQQRARRDIPPPPDGFTLDGDARDGDTFGLQGGGSLRLFGADAPELRQPGFTRDLTPVPIGQQAKAAADALVTPQSAVGALEGMSYGRPVAPVTNNGVDLGQSLIRAGNALAAPDYLKADPLRLGDYMEAERLARQNRLGVHGVYAQTPTDYRRQPNIVPDRETVAQFFDTPSQMRGLRPEIEQGYLDINRTGSVDDILAYAKANGFAVDPAKVAKFVKARDANKPVKFEMGYQEVAKPLTDLGDGAVGAAARGLGDGVLPNLLDEVGAVPDSFGLTAGRENVFNSERRWADIWANNTDQNRAIIGFDEMAHPYARLGGEVAGGLVVPFGSGARTVPQLAKVGAAYGGVAGFGGGETLAERATGAVVNAGAGAVVTGVGGKLLQEGLPALAKGWRWARGKSGEPVPVPDAPQLPPESPVGLAGREDGVPEGSALSVAPAAPEGQIPPPPPGFKVDRELPMAAEPTPALSADVRQPDYLDLGPARPRPLLRDATEAERAAQAAGIEARDVVPIPSNEIGSLEEAVSKDAGRVVQASPPREGDALTRRTVKNWRGEPVPKVGPIDLVGFLRLRGGLKPDELGELNALGLTNAARKGMDHVGQETRFGPLINPESGSTLDDAAFAAWEAGYFPELPDRPDIDTLIEALRDHSFGYRRRFLPEDQAEVEAFEAMRAERLDLEREQARTGEPLYLDRSVPADEPQPFPPIEAFEDWPAEAVRQAGNIRLDKLDSPQDISRALATVNNRVGFDAATRGRVTQAETERLAGELGMTPDALLARRKGQALNAEEALAARQILAKSGNELVNAAKRIQGLDDPGSELLADFQRKLVRHAAIQEQVAGATAEAGRALQQFRMMADSRVVRNDVLSAIVAGGGGRKRLKEAAETLIEAAETSPGVFNTVAEKAMKPKWRDKIAEWYVNALLGWPQTHVVNVTSNTLTAIAQIPEHATAALLGSARQLASRDPIDRITSTEVGARAFGLLQGAKEGARLFAQSLRTGEPSDFVSKVEGQQFKAIDGKLGEVVRIPTRFLTAEDELFKGIARRMELNGQAVRIARKEGLKGVARKARIAELVANPTDEMFQRALDYGRYLTFQTKLGPGAQGISNLASNHLAVKVLLPFVRTPTNLLKFAVERSPAAPLLREWRKDFIAGGERRDLAVAKALLGTGFGMAMYQAAAAGTITGSAPSDPKKKRLLYADGWKPYSIMIDGTFYSYKRLDPFSTTIGVAADLATLPGGMTEKQRQDKSTLLIASIMGNLANKTWLSGASSFIEAISEPERYAGDFKNRLVASFLLPNVVGGTARALDPTAREVGNFSEELQSRIPGQRDDLLPRRDVWGRAIVNEGGLGPDAFSPIWVSTALNDPVNHELMQLDYAPGYPGKKVGSRELTPAEYDRYQALAGERSHKALTTLVTSPDWKALDDEARVKAAKDVVGRARETARAELFGGSAKAAKAKRGDVPPPPPGFAVEGESAGRNVYRDLQEAIPGVRFTSGFRDYRYNQRLKARGYQAADNTTHMDGDTFDMLPPPGKSLGWLRGQVKRLYPESELLVHDGHLHGRFPGYYGAPVLGGAKAAGVRNPYAGMPAPPAGFTLDR